MLKRDGHGEFKESNRLIIHKLSMSSEHVWSKFTQEFTSLCINFIRDHPFHNFHYDNTDLQKNFDYPTLKIIL